MQPFASLSELIAFLLSASGSVSFHWREMRVTLSADERGFHGRVDRRTVGEWVMDARPVNWELVVEHMQLVRNLAGNVLRTLPACANVSHADLCDVGFEGLLRAAQRFDAKRGFKFSTYAQWRIRGAMLDWLARTDRDRRVLSLKQLARDEEGETVLDWRGDLADPRPNAETQAVAAWAWELVARLSPRRRRVIELYYREGWTEDAIARELGVTQSNICRLHASILKTLRRWAQAQERKAA